MSFNKTTDKNRGFLNSETGESEGLDYDKILKPNKTPTPDKTPTPEPTTPTTTTTANDTWRQAIENYGNQQKDYLTNLYDQMKDSSYKTLLNNRIAVSIAKEQALKNSNTALKANGFGSQGLAESNMSSQRNAYINALGSANASYNDEISGYNQEYASKMSDISATQDQYYLNYLQNQAENERSDNATALDDFISGISTQTTDESRQKYVEGRITTDKEGNYYLDGRKLSQNEVTRYKSAMYNLDESVDSATTDSEGNLTIGDVTPELTDEFGVKHMNSVMHYYDSNGTYHETWKSDAMNKSMGNMFGNSVDTLVNTLKNTSYNDGTIFKLTNSSGEYTYAMYKGGKLYHVKDGNSLWNKIGNNYGVVIEDGKVTSTGSKAKRYN